MSMSRHGKHGVLMSESADVPAHARPACLLAGLAEDRAAGMGRDGERQGVRGRPDPAYRAGRDGGMLEQ
eukprot:scaffold196599_cov30-Tisochrysis_lutea.AAC.2